jgi:ribosomal protein L37AE/L43A
MASKWWLLLEKSDETRISQGIDPYMDDTGRTYRYDSLVPNHKNLAVNDGVVIRKENEILGTCFIDEVTSSEGLKTHRRCPSCKSTDVRERITRTPRWKCGSCTNEFTHPTETQSKVTAYVATLRDFTRLTDPPTVRQARACAKSGNGEKSQHSMIELDATLLESLLGKVLPPPAATATRPSIKATGGQGFGLTAGQRTAVELHAMKLTAEAFGQNGEGWVLEDTSKTQPYDFYATRGTERLYIEVKGTTGTGESVILTHREVDHARTHSSEMALVVVTNIALEEVGGTWRATGGTLSRRIYPWSPESDRLAPTEYRYTLPTTGAVTRPSPGTGTD